MNEKAVRRLVLCLDGTWNNRDDSTNVLHHHALAVECEREKRDGVSITQRRYYHEGVGTGPLDRITGGGFGIGLEANVRAAYDWLVATFQEGDAPQQAGADEIYIFGFSRGAYTARSLVGFISTCGLLRRGAPLSVNQLWDTYCLLGREREKRGGMWQTLADRQRPAFRRITDLVWDPWLLRPDTSPAPGEVPGQRVGDLTADEWLLVRASRRVRITYLGLYDTVGSLGWDAFAIPGLQSRIAFHHNLRPTTIVGRCRHALAIDEHRSNFEHTPFVAFIGPDEQDESGRLEVEGRQRAAEPAVTPEQRWAERIEQRWFAGAHSNVGGGYPSDILATEPLRWVLEGATREGLNPSGLLCEMLPTVQPPASSCDPVDSFAQFAFPIWTWIVRAKRNYRTIAPPHELRAGRPSKEGARPGFALASINESIDPDALQMVLSGTNPPPNVISYLTRFGNSEVRLDWTPFHAWVGGAVADHAAVLLWGALGALGVADGLRLFCGPGVSVIPAYVLGVIAAALVAVDWTESTANWRQALRPTVQRRAFLDSIYWTRALGMILFVIGAAGTIGRGVAASWTRSGLQELATLYGPLLLGAAASVAIVTVVDRWAFGDRTPHRGRSAALSFVAAPAALAVTLLFLAAISTAIGFALGAVHLPQGRSAMPTSLVANPDALFAGSLLLIELALIYFVRAFAWVGEPTSRANLESIVKLQLCFTPAQVTKRLTAWRDRLTGGGSRTAATTALASILRAALWRDIIGFIPVYGVVLGAGVWFAVSQLMWPPELYALPVIAVATDYVEDACHLAYIRRFEAGELPAVALTALSFTMSVIKLATFALTVGVVLAALAFGSWTIAHDAASYGIRGLLAVALPVISVALVVAMGVALAGWFYWTLQGSNTLQPSVDRKWQAS